MVTELKPTNLIAVEVAPDASNYRWGHHVFGIIVYPNDLCYDTSLNVWKEGDIIVPEGNYKILGEVTKDKIGFDVKELGEVPLSSKESHELLNSNDKIDFYKFLAANGLYFENPISEFERPIATSIQDLSNKWQSYENNLIKGKLLILEKC
jgi:hypothetical protein